VGYYRTSRSNPPGRNEAHRFLVAEQARLVGKPTRSIVLEPAGRNTAPALTCAALISAHRGEEVYLLAENQSTYIPLGVKHRLENPGTIPLELIEVQSGPYLGEDDIVRFEDVYNRASPVNSKKPLRSFWRVHRRRPGGRNLIQ
jgi:Mannose-6-phosphate isomerase